MKYGKVTNIERKRIGWFMLEPEYNWIAYCYNQQVAQAKTKAECIKMARERGYSVPRNVI